MSGDQMSSGSNVHFWVRDQMSSGSNVHFGSGIESLWDQKTGNFHIRMSGIECLFWGRGSNVRDQMSILGSGIKCPFWSRGSKVRGSNVHFGLGDQKSGDQMSGDQMSSGSIVHFWVGDQMSSGSNVHFGLGIESQRDQKSGDQNSEIKSLGIRSPGINCPSPLRSAKF